MDSRYSAFVSASFVSGVGGAWRRFVLSAATASGKLDLSAANAYKALLGPNGTGGVMSDVDKTRILVVPGMPKQSYFYFITRGLKAEDGDPPFTAPPANVGLMPQKGSSICCQKIDAIERWITAGAMND